MELAQVIRQFAKYVFLDVVQFSQRSAEAQSEIVQHLNRIVGHSLSRHHVNQDSDCILIPTGDGICVALLGQSLPYDIHMQVALSILESISSHNKATENPTRRFEVRIGINQNTDIIVTDINNRRNLAGAGINTTARIMDIGDGNQILVSRSVFDELEPSEKFNGKFRHYEAKIKHGLILTLYQYIDRQYEYLNNEIPGLLAKNEGPVLTQRVAYYLAHALKSREIIIEISHESPINKDALQVILWLLAIDSEWISTSAGTQKNTARVKFYGHSITREQFAFYSSQDDAVISRYNLDITRELLAQYSDLFEWSGPLNKILVNEEGCEKLKNQWPSIWEEFQLETTGNLSRKA